MLRRTVKRNSKSSATEKSRKIRKTGIEQRPLGSKKSKDEEEHKLETLVLGGDDDLIEKLVKSDRLKEERLHGDDLEEVSTGRRFGKQERKPAWVDEDDQTGSIILTNDRKFTGIKHESESRLRKKEYTQRLKTQFEKVSSTPNWAKLPSEQHRKSDDDDSDVEEIQHKTGDYLSKSASLPKGVLQIKQCTDLNKDSPLKGKLKALQFHPIAQVALTGGMNGTLSLFQVDGKTNSKIQSIFLEDFPIYCAHFSTNGEEVVMGSRHKTFQYYDMIAGKVVRVPQMKGLEENSMSYFEVSPDGKYVVFMGKHGKMHLISSKSKEWITTLKMNGTVNSLAFTNDGTKLFSHGDDGQVYVWDIRSRDCIHRFMDEGCTQGTTIDVSPNSQYIACGSSTGVVNLYETETCLSSFEPKPLRAIMNLTTSCTATKFNSSSEILAVASDQADKAVKMVHVSSGAVFSNFPDRTDINLRIPKSLDFSVNSGYFTIGTHKGKALLYRLKHYSSY